MEAIDWDELARQMWVLVTKRKNPMSVRFEQKTWKRGDFMIALLEHDRYVSFDRRFVVRIVAPVDGTVLVTEVTVHYEMKREEFNYMLRVLVRKWADAAICHYTKSIVSSTWVPVDPD